MQGNTMTDRAMVEEGLCNIDLHLRARRKGDVAGSFAQPYVCIAASGGNQEA